MLVVGVLYTSHDALAVNCEVDCGEFPTITIPVPTIVFPTIVIPTIDFPFPSPTECPPSVTPEVTTAPTRTPEPTATPVPGQGLTHTEGNQGDGRGDGSSSCPSCTSAHTDTNGQVLGLASAGTFTDSVANSMMMLGMVSVALGMSRKYVKKS